MSAVLLTFSTAGYVVDPRPPIADPGAVVTRWVGTVLIREARRAWNGRPRLDTPVVVYVTTSLPVPLDARPRQPGPLLHAGGPAVLALLAADVIHDFAQALVVETDLWAGEPGALPEPGVSVLVTADAASSKSPVPVSRKEPNT